MRQIRRLLILGVAPLLLLAMALPTAAAPTACHGGGWVAPDFATFEMRNAGGVEFVTFEFFGEHDLCLADGSVVTGTLEGRLWQRIGRDGSIDLRFVETLTAAGGTLDYRGSATLNAAGWNSHVRTVGPGTGALFGIHGQGTFSPLDPVTGAFSDEIFYVYP